MIQVSREKPPCAASLVVVRFRRTSSDRRHIIPDKKVYGGRSLLNLPGHHSTGAIVAEVVVSGQGKYGTYATVQISDCDRKITLDFSPGDKDAHENDLHKVDVMIDSLRKFRRGLVAAQKRVL